MMGIQQPHHFEPSEDIMQAVVRTFGSSSNRIPMEVHDCYNDDGIRRNAKEDAKRERLGDAPPDITRHNEKQLWIDYDFVESVLNSG